MTENQSSEREKFGRSAELADAGYIEMPDAPDDKGHVYGSDDESVRMAVDELAAGRGEEDDKAPLPVEYRTEGGTGELIDQKEAVSLEKASQDLILFHEKASTYVDGVAGKLVADLVDKTRADAVNGNPALAEAYGLDAKEVAEKGKAVDAKLAGDDPQQTASQEAEPNVEGLDPEVQKALKHPQVRQAIEDELGKADAAKQAYSNALTTANQFAQASLVDHFPELQQVPMQQWSEALATLAQVQPDRFQRAMGVLQRVDQLQTAQAQWQQHQAAERQQQFNDYTKAEEKRFDSLSNWSKLSKAEQASLSESVAEYAEGLGVDRTTLAHLWQNEPIMRHGAFQKMMVDAARYNALQKSPPKAVPKDLPPVQRPGARSAVTTRADDTRTAFARLNQSGSIDDALAALAAKRSAGRH